jgi:hypothetical protein
MFKSPLGAAPQAKLWAAGIRGNRFDARPSFASGKEMR